MPKSRFLLLIDEDELQAFKELCAASRRSVCQGMRELIRNELERNDATPMPNIHVSREELAIKQWNKKRRVPHIPHPQKEPIVDEEAENWTPEEEEFYAAHSERFAIKCGQWKKANNRAPMPPDIMEEIRAQAKAEITKEWTAQGKSVQ